VAQREGAAGRLARLLTAWARLAEARPRTVLAGLGLLLLAALAATATNLRVTSDANAMLAPDLPFERRVQALHAAFPRLDQGLVLGVTADQPETAEATARVLAGALGDAPEVRDVWGPAIDPFFGAHWPLYRDLAELERDLARISGAADLIARLRGDRSAGGFVAALAEAAERAATDPRGLAALDPLFAEAAAVWQGARAGQARPFSWQRALEGDAAAGTVWLDVTPRLDPSLLSQAEPALDAIAAATAALPRDLAQAVEIAVTGEAAMRTEEMESVLAGLGLSFAVSMLLVAGILWLGLGGALRAVLTLGVMLAALVLTTGFAALALGPLNLISVAFVVLMVGLGVDFPIHFLSHLRGAAGGAPGVAARLGGGLALAAATTAAGFAAFGTTDFIGLAQLGVIGAAGVVIAFCVTMTALPAVAALWPTLGAPGALPPTGRAAPAPPSRHALLLRGALGGIVALAGVAVATQARFDADPLNLRPADAPAARAFAQLAADPQTSPYRLHAMAQDAAAAGALAESLGALPEVAGVVWLGAMVPEGQDAKLELIDLAWPSVMHALEGTPAPAHGAATTRAALAARLAMPGAGPGAAALALELAQGDPPGLAAALFRHFDVLLDRLAALQTVAPVAQADLPEALQIRYRADDGRQRIEVLPREDLRDPQAMADFVAAVHRVAPEAAGLPDDIAGAAGTVGAALATAAALALLATGAMVALATRRAMHTLAVVVPIVAAAALTAAGGVLLGMPFNYANMIVLPLLMGFGADTGIYLARAARGPESRATARAVLVSAATTAAAFGALALSPHPGTASMGALLVLALASVVAMAFTLTPALLALAHERRHAP